MSKPNSPESESDKRILEYQEMLRPLADKAIGTGRKLSDNLHQQNIRTMRVRITN